MNPKVFVLFCSLTLHWIFNICTFRNISKTAGTFQISFIQFFSKYSRSSRFFQYYQRRYTDNHVQEMAMHLSPSSLKEFLTFSEIFQLSLEFPNYNSSEFFWYIPENSGYTQLNCLSEYNQCWKRENYGKGSGGAYTKEYLKHCEVTGIELQLCHIIWIL